MSAPLADGQRTIVVWRLDMRVGAPPDWEILDERERAIADSFVYADDRERYGRTHCALRMLLSDHLGMIPADVPIAVGTSGKPFLAGAAQDVTFNMSHSRHTALIAIGRGAEIGIDIEDDDGATDYGDLIDTVFDEETAERINRGDPQSRRQLLLRGWTRKEAVAKALGSGFLIDPKHFPVPLDRAGPWTVCLQDGSRTFCLIDLSAPDIAAALAVDGREPRVLLKDYRPDRLPMECLALHRALPRD